MGIVNWTVGCDECTAVWEGETWLGYRIEVPPGWAVDEDDTLLCGLCAAKWEMNKADAVGDVPSDEDYLRWAQAAKEDEAPSDPMDELPDEVRRMQEAENLREGQAFFLRHRAEREKWREEFRARAQAPRSVGDTQPASMSEQDEG